MGGQASTADWFAQNAPTVTTEPSKIPATSANPPANTRAVPAGDWFDLNKPNTATIGPRAKTPVADAFNMTQEARAEHPILAKVTDLAKNAADYGRLLATMAPLAGGPAGDVAGALGAVPELEASGGWLGAGPASGGANAGAGYLERGASAASGVAQKLSSSIVGVIKAHPVIAGYVGTHLANALGVPLPKVLKALTLIPENPAE